MALFNMPQVHIDHQDSLIHPRDPHMLITPILAIQKEPWDLYTPFACLKQRYIPHGAEISPIKENVPTKREYLHYAEVARIKNGKGLPNICKW